MQIVHTDHRTQTLIFLVALLFWSISPHNKRSWWGNYSKMSKIMFKTLRTDHRMQIWKFLVALLFSSISPHKMGSQGGNYSKMSKMMFNHFIQIIESKYENSRLPSFFEIYHLTIGGVEEEITQKCPKWCLNTSYRS